MHIHHICCRVIASLKPVVRDFKDHCSLLKAWIRLLSPKIEGGNNSGVSVQQSVLAIVIKCESRVESFENDMTDYFARRAKLVSKVTKYPHIVSTASSSRNC